MNQSISREIEEKVFRYVPVTPMDKRIIENFIQSKISEAIMGDKKELRDKIENQFDYIIKMVADNRVSFEDSLDHEYVDTCIPYKAVEKSRRIVRSLLEEK